MSPSTQPQRPSATGAGDKVAHIHRKRHWRGEASSPAFDMSVRTRQHCALFRLMALPFSGFVGTASLSLSLFRRCCLLLSQQLQERAHAHTHTHTIVDVLPPNDGVVRDLVQQSG